MADISALLIPYAIDADYAPEYAKLARILRGKIESGEYRQGEILSAADLAHEYIRFTRSTLAMLAANRHVSRPGALTSYTFIWQAGT